MQSLVQYDCSSDSTSEEDLPGSSHSDDVKYNQHKNGTGSKTQMSNGDEIRYAPPLIYGLIPTGL